MKKHQVSEHIRLNATLLVHSVCILVVIQMCTVEPNILWEMVAGEVIYRAFSTYQFWQLLKQQDGELRQQDGESRQRDGKSRQ